MDIDTTLGPHSKNQTYSNLKERVEAVDPNGGRCLIENYSSTYAIEYCHLVPLDFWCLSRVLNSLEWYWNMRAGTLNLDTRHNVFPAGASIHRLHDTGRWIIVPEEHIIEQYYTSLMSLGKSLLAWREHFPNIPNHNNFRYTLIPIQDMEDIALTRQTAIKLPLVPGDFTTHLYPYDDFPTLVSHVHPKFAIVSAGMYLDKLPHGMGQALGEKYPCLCKIMDLYMAWIALPPMDCTEDDSFYPPYDPDNNDDGDDLKDEDHKDTVTEKGHYRGNRERSLDSGVQPHEVDEYEVVEVSEGDSLVTRKGRCGPYGGVYRKRKRNRHKRAGNQKLTSGKRKQIQAGGLSQAGIDKHTGEVGKMEWDRDALHQWSSQILEEKQVADTDMTAESETVSDGW